MKTINLNENISNSSIENYEYIFNTYQKKIYNFIFKITYSKEDSEDIVQETFIKVYKYLNTYNNNYSFSSWIFKIAINEYNYYQKKNVKLNILENKNLYYILYKNNIVELDNLMIIQEDYSYIIDIINNLKYEYKVAIILRYFKDYTYNDISITMNKKINTVKSFILRAKKIISQKYKNKLL